MATYRLSKGAVKKIHGSVDHVFDNLKTRALGPGYTRGKRLYVTYRRDLSLPGIFEHAASEEGNKPDTSLLDSLLSVASNYIDATKERSKAKIVAAVNAALGESSTGKPTTEQVRTAVESELVKLWDEMTGHVKRIVETEGNNVRNVGLFDSIVKMNATHGIDDPTVYFVVVRDTALCAECKRLHLMSDGATPRLWKLSEVGHGYHTRGDADPKLGGLHPHCRCVMVTLLPGFGFHGKGTLGFTAFGHNELERQRAEAEPLQKAEGDEKYPNPDTTHPLPHIRDHLPAKINEQWHVPAVEDDGSNHPVAVQQKWAAFNHDSNHQRVLLPLGKAIEKMVGAPHPVGNHAVWVDPDLPHPDFDAYHDNKGNTYVSKAQALRLAEMLNPGRTRFTPEHEDAFSLLLHEFGHGASHKDYPYEGAHKALEEATTEILAEHYGHQIQRHVTGTGMSHAGAPLFVPHPEQGVEATRPHGYMYWTKNFAKLIGWAENLHSGFDVGDPYQHDRRLSQVIAHHALQVKRRAGGRVWDRNSPNGEDRLGYLAQLIMRKRLRLTPPEHAPDIHAHMTPWHPYWSTAAFVYRNLFGNQVDNALWHGRTMEQLKDLELDARKWYHQKQLEWDTWKDKP